MSLFGAFLTLVALAIFSWPEIEGAYHLWKLRRQPELVEPWLRAGEEDYAKSEALRRFFLERQGAEVLFRLYLSEYDKRQYDTSTVADYFSRRRATGRVGDHGHLYLGKGNFGYAFMRGDAAKQMYSTMNIPNDVERRRAILARMDACVGKSFTVEEFPGYEFYVQAIVDGEAEPPPWRSKKIGRLKTSRAGHVCFFRMIEYPEESRPSADSQTPAPSSTAEK